MVDKKEWSEFRKTGLALIINQILHVFGWSIVFEIENNKIKEVYPARVKFRGFSNDDTSEAYEKVSKYLKENSNQLYKETQE